MSFWRKKPILIEAVQAKDVTRARDGDWTQVPAWAYRAWCAGKLIGTGRMIAIHTLEGTMLAEPDDWIIKGVKGELYPCKPDIFSATYEAAEYDPVLGVKP